jgi:prepilin-type processing-associated H-X9-DG protein
MFNALQTPNDSTYRFNGCRVGCAGCGIEAGLSFPATSQHPGGVNALMGDGSTRFIKDTVDRNTWYSLSTREGTEVLGSDSY